MDNIYIKQLIIYIFSLFMFYGMRSNKLFFKYITIIYVVFCFLLLSLLLFTEPINNAKCWFTIANIATFQPSEFVKIFLVIMISTILTKNINYKWIKALIIFLIPTILTFLEPDSGLVIIYTIGFLGIISCYLKKYRYLLIPFLVLFLFGITIIILYTYNQKMLLDILGNSFVLRINRIINWKNQEGYQLSNALIAIGSNGSNISFNKINTYFPEAHTDFIFASFASSFGFILSIMLLIFLLYFDLFLFDLAKNESNKRNKLIIIGFASMFLYQQIQSIGMNLGLLPITGITLPFISYGGSSLISSVLMLTIIKNMQEKKE